MRCIFDEEFADNLLILCPVFSGDLLEEFNTALVLRLIVIFTLSSLKTRASGGGRKSFTILIFPMGSFVYLVFFFIDLP